MLRRLNPEMVLGALFATMLWVGIWGWHDSYALTEKQKDECYETTKNTGQKSDECKTFWERTTSDPIAFFTLVLAISTVGLWVATIFLYSAGERQIGVAKESADAANLSAQAVINADRAHLYVIIKQHNVSDIIDATGGMKYSVKIAKDRITAPTLAYVFKNYGKTPAVIEEAMHCMAIQKTEGGRRMYETLDRAIEILGEREESDPLIAVAFEERQFTVEDGKSLGDHDTMLFFYSGATFRDAFNRRHKIRHDFLYSAGRFHLISREEQSEDADEPRDRPQSTGFFRRSA
jgi:hypothetical protein